MKPVRGELVLFKSPDDPQVRRLYRIVGLGGESISIEDKVVLVDGQPLTEPFVQHEDRRIFDEDIPRDNMKPILLAEDTIFVLGDNRDYSMDSRFFGAVPLENLDGRVLYVYWSPDPSRVGSRPGQIAQR